MANTATTTKKVAKTKTAKAEGAKAPKTKKAAVLTREELIAKYEKQMATYQADIDKQAAVVEKSIADGFDGYPAKLEKLKDYVKAYNKAWVDKQFVDLCGQEEPLVAAINQLYVKVKTVKERRSEEDSKSIEGVDFDSKTKKIDLKAFATFAKLDRSFWTEGVHLFDMIQLYQMHGVFNLSRTELCKKTPYFERIYNEQVEKDTPVSNRQLEQAVTKVVELVYPHEHRQITKYDVAFFLNAVTKYNNKADAGIASVNRRVFGEILISALHAIIGQYDYTYNHIEVK